MLHLILPLNQVIFIRHNSSANDFKDSLGCDLTWKIVQNVRKSASGRPRCSQQVKAKIVWMCSLRLPVMTQHGWEKDKKTDVAKKNVTRDHQCKRVLAQFHWVWKIKFNIATFLLFSGNCIRQKEKEREEEKKWREDRTRTDQRRRRGGGRMFRKQRVELRGGRDLRNDQLMRYLTSILPW